MNNNEFISKLKEIVSMNTVYMWGCFGQKVTQSIITAKTKQYPSWYTKAKQSELKKLIGKNYYGFDCVCLIKAILWGFPNTKYASNGVPDIGADTMITKCNNISTDFGNITPGEAVWLNGHIGIYIGNGQVIECTPIWKNGVQITQLSQRKWVKHGKLPYIEYVSEKKADPIINNSQGQVYVVVKGDTLTKIAKQFGTTIQAIANANNIANVNLINIGQRLTIPTNNNAQVNKTKTITANSGLILREKATTNSNRLGAYTKGTKVTVIAENIANANGFTWDKVQVNGKTGYMANKYLA